MGNEELIAINQDSLGVQASRVKRDVQTDGTTEVWGGPLSDNRYVLILFNRGEDKKNIFVSISNDLKVAYDNYSQRDVINHKDMGISTNDKITAEVQRHSVVAYVLKFYKDSEKETTKKRQNTRGKNIQAEEK